jgi:LmbE family N-acetylglucosaminyl deacetylase
MVTQPAVLLTIMAHPDDAELWAGGTIAQHVRNGGTATLHGRKIGATYGEAFRALPVLGRLPASGTL